MLKNLLFFEFLSGKKLGQDNSKLKSIAGSGQRSFRVESRFKPEIPSGQSSFQGKSLTREKVRSGQKPFERAGSKAIPGSEYALHSAK